MRKGDGGFFANDFWLDDPTIAFDDPCVQDQSAWTFLFGEASDGFFTFDPHDLMLEQTARTIWTHPDDGVIEDARRCTESLACCSLIVANDVLARKAKAIPICHGLGQVL